MNNLSKLLLSLVLAAAAAFCNWAYLAGLRAPKKYLAVAVDVKSGGKMPESDDGYMALALPADSSITNQLIPFDGTRKYALFGMLANRDFKRGEPVFVRDVQDPVPQYTTLGPFTLLSVGDQLTGVEDDQRSGAGAGTLLTIDPEVQDNVYPPKTRQLLQIIESQRRQRDGTASSNLRIVAIEAIPRKTASDGLGSLMQSERALIVPIEGVPNIPKVLLVGDQINFVIPTAMGPARSPESSESEPSTLGNN